MVLVTTSYISDRELATLGMVRGATVFSKNIGSDIAAGFKNLVGGELKGYTDMLNKSREIAIQRMSENAQEMGADAIVDVRFASSTITSGAAEVMAYGTAVKFK